MYNTILCSIILIINYYDIVKKIVWSFEGIVQGRLEVCGHDIIDQIIEVGSIDEALSLVARVHGSPAELVIRSLSLHEAPHRTTHHRNRLLVRHDEDLSCLVYVHSLAEKLTCI